MSNSNSKPARTIAMPGEVSTTRPAAEAVEAVDVPPVEAAPDFAGMSKDELVVYLQEQHTQTVALRRLTMDLHAKQRRETAVMPEPVKHPKLADVIASNPQVPTLTDQGYYVPRVTLANPEQSLKH